MKTTSFFLIAVLTSCIFAPRVHSAEAVKSENKTSATRDDPSARIIVGVGLAVIGALLVTFLRARRSA